MLNVRPLNETLQKTAIEQLNEVPERVAADIEALRTWINQQPYLRARTDDQFLLTFLRGCKFSLEKSKTKIDKYYTLRSKYPELLTCVNVDDPKLREVLRSGVLLHLPTPLNDNGPKIAIIRSGIYSPNDFNIADMARLSFALVEILLLEDDYANINGVVTIMDVANATAAHFLQMTPGIIQKTSVYSEEALPIRQKATHFLNTFAAFEPFFNLVKPMLSKKQQGRLFVHGSNMDSLYEQIPKKYLPKEYGGDNGTVADIIAYWERKLDEYREHFKDNANYGTDELLRPGKPIDFDTMFGTDGSFRKLNVD